MPPKESRRTASAYWCRVGRSWAEKILLDRIQDLANTAEYIVMMKPEMKTEIVLHHDDMVRMGERDVST